MNGKKGATAAAKKRTKNGARQNLDWGGGREGGKENLKSSIGQHNYIQWNTDKRITLGT